MALGQQMFNRKGNYSGSQNQRVNVISGYRFVNNADKESGMGAAGMSVSFWSDLLKLAIAPMVSKANVEYPVYDRENEIAVYLTAPKARILANEIHRFIESNGEIKNTGVTTGTSFISISDGSEFGLDKPVVSIRKFNKELSSIEAEIIFIIRTDLFYSIHNFTNEEMNGEQDFETYKYYDLENLATILEEYYKAMTHAYAYSVLDRQNQSNHSINAKIEAIAESLGVSNGGNSVKSGGGNSSMNTGGSGFSSGSIDDL